MRLSDNTPVDVNDYTWGQRGDGSRRLPGMADISVFTDVFDPRLNVLTVGDTMHDTNVYYTWGLDSAEDASGGFGSGKGAPSMGDTGDVPDTDMLWHGYGIKGDETRLAQTERHPDVDDNNDNYILAAPGEEDLAPILLPIERITEKPTPVPGRGAGDSGAMAMPASPQAMVRYNALGVAKRFSEDYSHGDLGMPFAALPEWQEWAIPNPAPTPTSSGATQPNTRTRQSTFTTLRVPPSQWDSQGEGDYQAYDRWGA